jgi:hypothetical protein
MASRPVLLTALFDQFTSFVTELSGMYPDDPDFPLFLTSVRLLKSTNPSLLSEYIYESVNQYEDKIMAKDEKFFLEYSFDSHSETVDMNIIQKLKQYVTAMSPESKENVWKYVQNITRLSKACESLRR